LQDAAHRESEARISQLGEQLATSRQKCTELEADLAAAKAHAADDAVTHEATVGRLNADIATGQSQVARLQEQLGQEGAAAAALREEISSLSQTKVRGWGPAPSLATMMVILHCNSTMAAGIPQQACAVPASACMLCRSRICPVHIPAPALLMQAGLEEALNAKEAALAGVNQEVETIKVRSL
jgi:hypothetical protein